MNEQQIDQAIEELPKEITRVLSIRAGWFWALTRKQVLEELHNVQDFYPQVEVQWEEERNWFSSTFLVRLTGDYPELQWAEDELRDELYLH